MEQIQLIQIQIFLVHYHYFPTSLLSATISCSWNCGWWRSASDCSQHFTTFVDCVGISCWQHYCGAGISHFTSRTLATCDKRSQCFMAWYYSYWPCDSHQGSSYQKGRYFVHVNQQLYCTNICEYFGGCISWGNDHNISRLCLLNGCIRIAYF